MLETETCVHHYDLDRDMLGTCRRCGATRQYPQPWAEPLVRYHTAGHKVRLKSKYRGVRIGADGYYAIWLAGRGRHEPHEIGRYETEAEAARAYNEHTVKVKGREAVLNVIEEDACL